MQRARARYITALKIGIAYMMFMGIIFIVFRRQLIGLFLEEAEVIRFGGRFLIFAALFQLFDATAIVTGSALKGAGDTKWPMVMMTVSHWLVVVGGGSVVVWLKPEWGSLGPWVVASLLISLTGILLWARWRSRAWTRIDLLAADDGAPIELPSADAGHPAPGEVVA